MLVRNFFYDLKILKTLEVDAAQVICIGNITSGGTGKTPLTAFLFENLKAKGFETAIISRGYGGTYDGEPIQVKTELKDAAQIFGDEPTWFAEKLNAPVWVGRDKYATALAVMNSRKSQVILADDAFQHRRLGRKLNILVIDASARWYDYLPLPLGRGREDFYFGIRRADVIVLNKVNLVSSIRAQKLKRKLSLLKREASFLVEASNRIERFSSLNNSQDLEFRDLKGKSVFLVSGIARPEQFARLVAENSGAKIVGHLKLPDHSNYDSDVLAEIRNLAVASNAKYILVTEKDAVKLKNVDLPFPILVSGLKLSSPELMDAVLSRVSR